MTNCENFEIYLRTQRGDLKPRHFNGILHLKHNEDFSLVIENNSMVKVKAECFISGENIGTIVLKIGQKLVLTLQPCLEKYVIIRLDILASAV